MVSNERSSPSRIYCAIDAFFATDLTASSARTREALGWWPNGPTLYEDIAAGAYQ
jgi:hypothetical protein